MHRFELVAIARSWLGTPWRHQAMRKHVGVDCIGLIAGVALEAGLVDARPELRKQEYRAYGREPIPDVLMAACYEYLDEIMVADAGLADIVLMRVRNSPYPQHFGIISEIDEDGKPYYMVHATCLRPRKVIENRIDKTIKLTITKYFRFKGVEWHN